MSDYIVHKAVDFDKVSAKVRKMWGASSVDDLSGRFSAQLKYDGCNTIMDLRDYSHVLSRTGEKYVSMKHQHIDAQAAYGRDLVLLGEAWHPELPFNETSGAFRRREQSNLELRVFDCLTTREWDQGYSDIGWADRFQRFLERYMAHDTLADSHIIPARAFNPGTYGPAQHLCNVTVENTDVGHFDGLILRDPNGTWVKGASGTTGEIVKVKRKLSFTLRVQGVQPGQGKLEGMAGALLVGFRGKTLSVNGGTFAERKVWMEDPGAIIGKLIEVEAMDYSSDGLLREPRNKGLRHDVVKADDE